MGDQRKVKDWRTEDLSTCKYSYKQLDDGRNITRTFGTTQRPVKSCIRFNCESNKLTGNNESLIFDVLYQINFTKPKPLVENAPEKDTVSEKPKFKFRKQSYTIKDPLLDEDPQIFKFKQQKDEAAYAYLLKWLDIGRLILNEAKTSYYNLKQFFENSTPDIFFGVSLGFQIAAL